MTFHTQVVGANGQRQAMFIERVEGLAETILSNFELRPPDVMIVFSAGGGTAVPIEMALGARARGLTVVAVTSVAPGRRRGIAGTRLLDHADVVLDLCTPVGDALVELDGVETPVGPGSTIAAVALVNAIKVRTAELLARAGRAPAGADERRARRRRRVARGSSRRRTPSTRAAPAGCYARRARIPALSHSDEGFRRMSAVPRGKLEEEEDRMTVGRIAGLRAPFVAAAVHPGGARRWGSPARRARSRRRRRLVGARRAATRSSATAGARR